MITKREATPAQLDKLRLVKKEFGHAVQRSYRIDQRTGHMFVKVLCAAGTWHWRFDTDGDMVDRHLSEPLPGLEAADETESAFIAWADANPVEP